jgi:hypothetical protein
MWYPTAAVTNKVVNGVLKAGQYINRSAMTKAISGYTGRAVAQSGGLPAEGVEEMLQAMAWKSQPSAPTLTGLLQGKPTVAFNKSAQEMLTERLAHIPERSWPSISAWANRIQRKNFPTFGGGFGRALDDYATLIRQIQNDVGINMQPLPAATATFTTRPPLPALTGGSIQPIRQQPLALPAAFTTGSTKTPIGVNTSLYPTQENIFGTGMLSSHPSSVAKKQAEMASSEFARLDQMARDLGYIGGWHEMINFPITPGSRAPVWADYENYPHPAESFQQAITHWQERIRNPNFEDFTGSFGAYGKNALNTRVELETRTPQEILGETMPVRFQPAPGTPDWTWNDILGNEDMTPISKGVKEMGTNVPPQMQAVDKGAGDLFSDNSPLPVDHPDADPALFNAAYPDMYYIPDANIVVQQIVQLLMKKNYIGLNTETGAFFPDLSDLPVYSKELSDDLMSDYGYPTEGAPIVPSVASSDYYSMPHYSLAQHESIKPPFMQRDWSGDVQMIDEQIEFWRTMLKPDGTIDEDLFIETLGRPLAERFNDPDTQVFIVTHRDNVDSILENGYQTGATEMRAEDGSIIPVADRKHIFNYASGDMRTIVNAMHNQTNSASAVTITGDVWREYQAMIKAGELTSEEAYKQMVLRAGMMYGTDGTTVHDGIFDMNKMDEMALIQVSQEKWKADGAQLVGDSMGMMGGSSTYPMTPESAIRMILNRNDNLGPTSSEGSLRESPLANHPGSLLTWMPSNRSLTNFAGVPMHFNAGNLFDRLYSHVARVIHPELAAKWEVQDPTTTAALYLDRSKYMDPQTGYFDEIAYTADLQELTRQGMSHTGIFSQDNKSSEFFEAMKRFYGHVLDVANISFREYSPTHQNPGMMGFGTKGLMDAIYGNVGTYGAYNEILLDRSIAGRNAAGELTDIEAVIVNGEPIDLTPNSVLQNIPVQNVEQVMDNMQPTLDTISQAIENQQLRIASHRIDDKIAKGTYEHLDVEEFWDGLEPPIGNMKDAYNAIPNEVFESSLEEPRQFYDYEKNHEDLLGDLLYNQGRALKALQTIVNFHIKEIVLRTTDPSAYANMMGLRNTPVNYDSPTLMDLRRISNVAIETFNEIVRTGSMPTPEASKILTRLNEDFGETLSEIERLSIPQTHTPTERPTIHMKNKEEDIDIDEPDEDL